MLLGDSAYITQDIDAEEKELSRAKISPDGSLGTLEKSSFEDMEKALAAIAPQKVFIKNQLFEDLKRIFGRDVEILVNY